MRVHRIITGLVAFALIGLVPFVSTTSAGASTSHGAITAAHSDAAATTERRQLPEREIVIRGVERASKLILKGKVKGDPKYAHKLVKVERRIGRDGQWKVYKKLQSGSLGGFRTQVGAPRTGKWFFRAMTPQTNSYRKSYSNVLYSYSY